MNPSLITIGLPKHRIWWLLCKELLAEFAVGQTLGSRPHVALAAALCITGNDVKSGHENKISQIAKNRVLLSKVWFPGKQTDSCKREVIGSYS